MTRKFALASAKAVAVYLKKIHGATRVVLFGSVVERNLVQPNHRIQVVDLHDESLIWLLPYREVQKAGVKFA